MVRKGIIQTVKDSKGMPILDIRLCERCRAVYWSPSPILQPSNTSGATIP